MAPANSAVAVLNQTSYVVREQIPEFVREDHPQFVRFWSSIIHFSKRPTAEFMIRFLIPISPALLIFLKLHCLVWTLILLILTSF